MVSLGFLKFIFGFEIDVCISFVAHLITRKLKKNIFKGLFYLSTIGGDPLLQLWLNAKFTVPYFLNLSLSL